MAQDIKSFVFFDIEGTGLPRIDGTAKIMEISFVACSVDHFVSSGQDPLEVPRVLHKLSLCVNPFKRVCEESFRITGLDNFILEHESRLGVRELEMITKFLERLQQPVCLVAHNGMGYDFPLLRKEFLKQQVAFPEDLLCLDSLVVFREIDKVREREREEDAELLEFIQGELVWIEEMEKSFRNQQGECSRNPPINHQEAISENGTSYEILCQLNAKEDKEDVQKINETTPKRSTNRTSPPRVPRIVKREKSPSSPETPRKAQEQIAPKSKKKLFPERKSFRLGDIYRRSFNHEPDNSHRAEADCLILLKCALKESRDFYSFAQKHSQPFRDVSTEKCVF
ncbi:three-prime repair exonuclease 1 [Sergentomyia squamirostris]